MLFANLKFDSKRYLTTLEPIRMFVLYRLANDPSLAVEVDFNLVVFWCAVCYSDQLAAFPSIVDLVYAFPFADP